MLVFQNVVYVICGIQSSIKGRSTYPLKVYTEEDLLLHPLTMPHYTLYTLYTYNLYDAKVYLTWVTLKMYIKAQWQESSAWQKNNVKKSLHVNKKMSCGAQACVWLVRASLSLGNIWTFVQTKMTSQTKFDPALTTLNILLKLLLHILLLYIHNAL